jgi:hypothetical protein
MGLWTDSAGTFTSPTTAPAGEAVGPTAVTIFAHRFPYAPTEAVWRGTMSAEYMDCRGRRECGGSGLRKNHTLP